MTYTLFLSVLEAAFQRGRKMELKKILTLKLQGGPNGPTFKNIGLWFTGEKKCVGMHVNLVYNIFDE